MAESSLSPVLIAGGEVIDATGRRHADVRIAEGAVVEVGASLAADGAQVLDAAGCIVSPGFVDLHTHLRQPGREEAETIETGSRCAALGGYTAVVAMPNTTPAMDNAGTVREVLELGRTALCEVVASGAITLDRAGTQLAPMAELASLGVRIFTDDGTGVQDDRLMRRALEYASGLGVTLAQHCEVTSLSEGTCMHEGAWSSRLGLPGQPSEAEEIMVMRDIALARLTGARVHFQHLSTAGSVALVRAAKTEGLAVTAEATTHHFTLTDACVAGYDPVFKVHPPLRTDGDVAAVRAGLGDGTIDAIATDHAPHTTEDKERPFDAAPPGMLGLETALALAITELTGDGAGPRLELSDVIALMSWRPAAIAGIDERHGRPITAGEPANLCVFDPTATWVVDPAQSASRSRNTPYAGRILTGRVRHTILAGTPTVIDGAATR
ncbi:MAG: dihydroorotase [Acidimicrobiia bacterium]|nr:dihydroorotase [Acidimicrobiia bacterium]